MEDIISTKTYFRFFLRIWKICQNPLSKNTIQTLLNFGFQTKMKFLFQLNLKISKTYILTDHMTGSTLDKHYVDVDEFLELVEKEFKVLDYDFTQIQSEQSLKVESSRANSLTN